MTASDPLRDLLAEALQANQDQGYPAEVHHRYHCGGSEARAIVNHIPPDTADLLRAVLADPEAARDGLAVRDHIAAGAPE